MTACFQQTALQQTPKNSSIDRKDAVHVGCATECSAVNPLPPNRCVCSFLFILVCLITSCGSATSSNTAAIATPVSLIPLTITNSVIAEADPGAPYAASLSAVGGAKPYSWSIVTGSLPTGVHLQDTTGVITGMTDHPGSYPFTAKVTDASRQSATLALNLKVSAALTIANSTLTAADAGAPYAAWLSASGGVTPYQWSLAAGSLPSGLQLQASSGTITGVTALSGSYPFSAKVTDSYGQTATLALNLEVHSTIEIANSTLLEAEVGTPYAASLSATGGAAPYEWSLGKGTLPSGMQLQPSGGTITGKTTRSGLYSFTAKVTDSDGQSAMQPFTIAVSSALSVANTTLVEADAGVSYTASLTANGGVMPDVWSLATGSLPAGMQLQASSGTITGTTAITGSYRFTAKVTDSYGQTATLPFTLTVTSSSTSGFDGPAELPRIYIQSAVSNTPAPGSTTMVNSGGDLQSALNGANCGGTIQLQAGSTFTGTFTFPAKSCDADHWIIVRTSADDSSLPAEGSRMTPCYAGISSLPGRPAFNCPSTNNVLAKLVMPVLGNGPIVFASGANYYRFIGLEITRSSGTGLVDALFSVVNGGAANNLILDRVWMHGTAQDETSRAVWLEGTTYVSIVDSFVTDFHCVSATGVCTDAQAIAGGVGNAPMGPYKITDNFLEASGESIMFGGGNATGTPADIQVAQNHMFKPLTWMKGQAGYVGGTNGNPFIVKNLFELKNAQRVLVDGNIMEDSWGGFTQVGFAILITPKNQAGSGGANLCPICQVTDVTIRNSFISHVGAGLQIANAFSDNGAVPLDGQRYSIHDIVIDDIDGGKYNGPGEFAQLSVAPGAPLLQNVTINHVTAFPSQTLFIIGDMVATTGQMKNVVFTNSIVNAAPFPVWSTGGGPTNCAFHDSPLTTFNACFANSTLAANAIIAPGSYTPASWPTQNFFPASATTVEFVNYNGGNGGNYELQPSSPYKGQGADGKDLGADVAAIESATTGVE